MKQGTTASIKFKNLKRLLGIPEYACIGILEGLWYMTANCAKQGDIGRFSNEEIAGWLEWSGDADHLIESLISARWLDRDEEHRLLIHNWELHAPNFVKGNLRNQKLPILSVGLGGGPRCGTKEGTKEGDLEGDLGPGPPSQVKSSQVKSSNLASSENSRQPPSRDSLRQETDPKGGTNSTAATEDVNAVIEHYRKHHPRARPGSAEKTKIGARLKEGYSVRDLCEAIDGCHASAFHQGDNDGGKKYLGLKLIMRDSSQVQGFIDGNKPQAKKKLDINDAL